MIAVPAGVRVLVATKPVDFRRGADSLAALVLDALRSPGRTIRGHVDRLASRMIAEMSNSEDAGSVAKL